MASKVIKLYTELSNANNASLFLSVCEIEKRKKVFYNLFTLNNKGDKRA